MYIPRHFKNDNLDEVRSFLKANAFGILINHSSDKILASHIPLELEINEKGKDVLLGHVSKGNEQWKTFESNQKVLAIFSGPHTYISSSWYDHVNVPTWNYIAVHLYGTIKIIDGSYLRKSLNSLINKYEKNSNKPVTMDEMPDDFVKSEIKGVVGFEIEITEIQSAYKLSQNRDSKNHTLIIDELEKKADNNSLEIAAHMKKNALNSSEESDLSVG